MSIEVDDLDKAPQAARATGEAAKGRVLQDRRRLCAAGQVEANIQ